MRVHVHVHVRGGRILLNPFKTFIPGWWRSSSDFWLSQDIPPCRSSNDWPRGGYPPLVRQLCSVHFFIADVGPCHGPYMYMYMYMYMYIYMYMLSLIHI